jgi:hypothetical protein
MNVILPGILGTMGLGYGMEVPHMKVFLLRIGDFLMQIF